MGPGEGSQGHSRVLSGYSPGTVLWSTQGYSGGTLGTAGVLHFCRQVFPGVCVFIACVCVCGTCVCVCVCIPPQCGRSCGTPLTGGIYRSACDVRAAACAFFAVGVIGRFRAQA
jgi:hypothetical protein